MALRRESPFGSGTSSVRALHRLRPCCSCRPDRFMAIARVSCDSAEIEPKLIAPVQNRLTISLAGSTSSNRNRSAGSARLESSTEPRSAQRVLASSLAWSARISLIRFDAVRYVRPPANRRSTLGPTYGARRRPASGIHRRSAGKASERSTHVPDSRSHGDEATLWPTQKNQRPEFGSPFRQSNDRSHRSRNPSASKI